MGGAGPYTYLSLLALSKGSLLYTFLIQILVFLTKNPECECLSFLFVVASVFLKAIVSIL